MIDKTAERAVAVGACTVTAMEQPGGPAPAPSVVVSDSYAHCCGLTRRHAKNFYWGMKLSPEPKRTALYAVYAWMRAADDLADLGGAPGEKLRRLDAFRVMTGAALDPGRPIPDGLIWPAVRQTLQRYRIPAEYLHAMLDGQRTDIEKIWYANFDELQSYCYKVASTVGLVCILIWGYDPESPARNLAEQRGIAFQLTNILRDLREDAQRGRVYLPADELERFGYTHEDLVSGRADDRFDRLMEFQIGRARQHYTASAPLEQHLDPSCRPASWAMTRIYQALLGRIARDPRRVLNQRVHLGRMRKLGIVMKSAWRARGNNE